MRYGVGAGGVSGCTITDGCDTSAKGSYSGVLTLNASAWGDATGDCGVTPCSPPNRTVDFIDITAILDKFKNTPGSARKSRGDISPSLVDRKVDFVDIAHAVGAFRGEAYPFPPPEPCR